jgi:xanthine/CO dehydrogenase XdhC/CoxF family maturation factor
MLNIADTLHRWCREARPFALATVVGVHGSAPLPVGTSVAVDEDGNAVGSISGGCVEGAVYELCRQVLHDRGAPQRAWFGYSDDDAFAVGLTCGGELDVLVQRIDPQPSRTCPRPSPRSLKGDRSPWHRSWMARIVSSAPR